MSNGLNSSGFCLLQLGLKSGQCRRNISLLHVLLAHDEGGDRCPPEQRLKLIEAPICRRTAVGQDESNVRQPFKF
jgi:hypothetical protein